MLRKENPIFTAYDVRRAISAGLVSENIHVAQLGAEEARWVADLEHDQEKLTVDLFAIGADDAFTPDRGVEVEITSTASKHPLVRFSVKETPRGFPGKKRIDSPFQVDYSFRAPLEIPRQVTPRDLVRLGTVTNLTQNQTLIADILNLSGVSLIAPRSEK